MMFGSAEWAEPARISIFRKPRGRLGLFRSVQAAAGDDGPSILPLAIQRIPSLSMVSRACVGGRRSVRRGRHWRSDVATAIIAFQNAKASRKPHCLFGG